MKAMSFDQLKTSAEAINAMPVMNVLSDLSTDKSLMDHFYLTGYEGLCLNLSHDEITRSVISSAVPMYGELLVVGAENDIAKWNGVCASLRIGVTSIAGETSETASLAESILKTNTKISHILCSSNCGKETIDALCAVAHKHRCAVIVDNQGDEINLAGVEGAGIDFAFSTAEGEQPISVFVARRSRLVMTEGNARQGVHDIYAVWQDSLASRNPTWAPMA